MADISAYLEQILESPRGETVRDSIVGSLKNMRDFGIDAKTLQGHKSNELLSLEQLNKAMHTTFKINTNSVYDKTLNETSKKAVESNSIYKLYKKYDDAFNEILGED